MANEISTVQSLKAVDAWIDVINANINGGVRTAYKTSRLKFGGNNANVARTGNGTSLPLQFPEAGLTTANTVIDFSQGAITSSTENSHLAIQGDGFFLLANASLIDTVPGATFGGTLISLQAKFFLSKDGEFHTDQNGFMRNAQGMYLMTWVATTLGSTRVVRYAADPAWSGTNTLLRAVYNDIDNPSVPAAGWYQPLSTYLLDANPRSLVTIPNGLQSLAYTSFGSTVYDFGFQANATAPSLADKNAQITLGITGDTANRGMILSKSLEASNASMTQSVPELSLAQKLFSALTKVLQISQTNTDAVLNLVR